MFYFFFQYGHQKDYTFKSSLFCVVGVWVLVFGSELFQIGVHCEWYMIKNILVQEWYRLEVCTERDFWNFFVPEFFENFSPGIFWSWDFSVLEIAGFFSPGILDCLKIKIPEFLVPGFFDPGIISGYPRNIPDPINLVTVYNAWFCCKNARLSQLYSKHN